MENLLNLNHGHWTTLAIFGAVLIENMTSSYGLLNPPQEARRKKEKEVNGHLEIEDQRRCSCWIIFIKRDASSRRCGPFNRERVEWKMDAHFLSCRLQQSGASSDMTSHSAAAAAGHPAPSI
ncbi:hypothetical protein DAPPUDRAFT_241073 [Daphnia pulex]|uniref:Uncharacterized protein n=1 Tax=Daphnia pulex TaxID=6669 RepID=E9GDC5_DAPPU|nr:hypothetical protein DAPPUDRAFT_241073 [Daphnia pulex]|eukprot:EFX82721.1 hypothetical protein DAPPUDRAFT_241073 [Daphnia pulex]